MITGFNKIITILLPLGFALTIAFWFSSYYQIAISADVSFLTISAEKMLQGLKMSEAYYDTNPPLSILIYAPAVLLSHWSSLPVYICLNIYFTVLFLISLALTTALTIKIPNMSLQQKSLIICSFAYASTVICSNNFGQKDHILGMFLFPLALQQLLLTYRIKTNALIQWSTLILGGTFILIKPHFGLIPLCLLGHRIVHQKRWNIYKDKDFITLGATTTVYTILLLTIWQDYIFEILPNVVDLYMIDVSSKARATAVLTMIIVLIPFVLGQTIIKKIPDIVQILSFLAFLCLIPVYIQGKGYPYHTIPYQIFALCTWAPFIYFAITTLLRKFKHINNLLGVIIATSFIFFYTMNSYKSLEAAPQKTTYISSEFTDIIKDCGQKKCKFFMFNDMINISNQLSLYADIEHASRFPFLWFLPALLYKEKIAKENGTTASNQQEINEKYNHFLSITMSDLKRYTPETLIIGRVFFSANPDTPFDFINFTQSREIGFKDIWNQYEFQKSITIDRIKYMIGKLPNETLITYDIYKRKDLIEKESTGDTQ